MTDLTVNTSPRTIQLKGSPSRFEAVAAGVITPGVFLKYSSAGLAVQNAAITVAVPYLIALENELIGLGIDDNYAANDFVQSAFFYPGCWVLGLVPAAAPAIAAGDSLERTTAGLVQKVTTGVPVAMAVDALDNSGGGTTARLRIVLF